MLGLHFHDLITKKNGTTYLNHALKIPISTWTSDITNLSTPQYQLKEKSTNLIYDKFSDLLFLKKYFY